MKGTFLAIWDELWASLWYPVQDLEFEFTDPECAFGEDFEVSEDLMPDLYRAVYNAFKDELKFVTYDTETDTILTRPIELATIVSDPARAVDEFKSINADYFASEAALVGFMQEAYAVFEEYDEILAIRYSSLLRTIIQRYSLRYELRSSCELCPTLPGIFTSLISSLKQTTANDPHLDELMTDFEESVSDLNSDSSARKIKTCMVKQINLLEALATLHSDTNNNTIGSICNDLSTWPHNSLKDAMKKLYNFTCNYPGIRHAGTPSNAIRPVDMRDMLGVTILLVGFLPYLTDRIDLDATYRGS
ncbi:MAG TPA: hypothetical protein DEA90_15370 [Opitutae bacterium]|nr:hypothetical protein [Puniceicoccaceae bacterium]HBR95541.1 hypothetical protein [Opitutae bacterium]|tara:strand:+ start:8267 stop:9178 length:912 start_codon:yes stop_codon:yes gene_type:complete